MAVEPAPLSAVFAEGLVSYTEACDALGISRYTLARMVRTGVFNSVRIGNRRYLNRAAVIAYIHAKRDEAKTVAQ